MLSLELHGWSALWFDDGSPVRAASAIAPFGSGWLVAQDDATHAAWWRDGMVTRLRLFPPVDGYDLFSEDDGTKRLKPDLEAACAIDADGTPGVLLLGSGSLPNRTRVALVTEGPTQPRMNTTPQTCGVYARPRAGSASTSVRGSRSSMGPRCTTASR